MPAPLIIAPLKDEIRGFKAKMAIDCTIHFKPATLYRGFFLNKEIELLVTGIGAPRIKKGLEETLSLKIPSAILLVGYAGGASPIAGLGSLILAQRVVKERDKKSFSSNKELLQQAKNICEEKKWPYQIGGMVSVDRVVSSPHEKADLGAVHEAIALDMEAQAMAALASERGIPWLVVKSILDTMEMELPNLQNCVEITGEAKPLLVMEHIFKQPRDLMKLPNIQYCAFQARESLTKFIEAWIQQG